MATKKNAVTDKAKRRNRAIKKAQEIAIMVGGSRYVIDQNLIVIAILSTDKISRLV